MEISNSSILDVTGVGFQERKTRAIMMPMSTRRLLMSIDGQSPLSIAATGLSSIEIKSALVFLVSHKLVKLAGTPDPQVSSASSASAVLPNSAPGVKASAPKLSFMERMVVKMQEKLDH